MIKITEEKEEDEKAEAGERAVNNNSFGDQADVFLQSSVIKMVRN